MCRIGELFCLKVLSEMKSMKVFSEMKKYNLQQHYVQFLRMKSQKYVFLVINQ